MRVGLFTSSLPEERRKIGGVEIFVHRLANALTDRGHRVVVCTFARSAPSDARYELRRAGSAAVATSKIGRLALCPALLNGLHVADLDVLNLHGDDWFYVRRPVPTVRTFHGSAWREAQSATRWQRGLVQAMLYPLELAASRLATSAYTVCAGMPRGYRLAGMLPQGGGLFPEMVDQQRRDRFPDPTVLFVGTWDGRKRGRWLRDVFCAEVLPRHPTARLLMVSDHCEESEGVEWFPHPDDRALSELYARSWLFCLPSTYEGFGQPYVEAMAHATPVVATPNPGLVHVAGERGAALIVADAQLGHAISGLLADGRWRQALATLGIERAGEFGWERACVAHEAAFAQAISLGSGRRSRTPT
ncbi:MAG: glycosyltransferase family 4 protein [Solirubrobacteraceae bacterium]